MVVLRLLAALLALATVPALAIAAPAQAPARGWQEAETDHFRIYHRDRLGVFASQVTLAVEGAYDYLTEVYDLQLPDKTTITIWDTSETSNGSADPIRNLVNLYGTTDEILLRGRHPWVANVVAHEFSHIFSLWDARIFRRQVPGVSVGGIAEWQRWQNRAGFYKFGASAFLPGRNIPRWFSEGIAQLDATRLGYDSFDTTRAMLLRSALLADGAVQWDSLHTTAGKSTIGAELVYNQGFAFLLWLADQHGDAKLVQLARASYGEGKLQFGKLFKSVYGLELDLTYQQWLQEATSQSHEVQADRRPEWPADPTASYAAELSDSIFELGRFTTFLSTDGEGNWLAVGSGESKYNISKLYFAQDITAGIPEKDDFDSLTEDILGTPAWDAGRVLYCRSKKQYVRNLSWARLYEYNLATSAETELARVRCKDLAARDSRIVAAVRHNNTHNLAVAPSTDPTKFRLLTQLNPPEVAHRPYIATDGWVYFELQSGSESDIARVHIDAPGLVETLPFPGSVESAPFVQNDSLYFVSDQHDGIGDVWQLPVTGGTPARISNSLGGFLAPVSVSDSIAGIEYHHESFAVHAVSDVPFSQSVTAIAWQARTALEAQEITLLETRPRKFRLAKPMIVPEFLYQNHPQAGFDLVLTDDMGFWAYELEFLVGREFDLSSALSYSGWYVPLTLSYDYFGRSVSLTGDDLFPGSGITQKLWFPSTYHAVSLKTEFKALRNFWVFGGIKSAWYEAHSEYTKIDGTNPYRNLDLWFQLSYSSIPLAPDSDANPRGGSAINTWTRWGHTWPGRFFDGFWRRYQYGNSGVSLNNYLPILKHWTLGTHIQGEAIYGKGGLKDVNAFDELFLGGEFFSLRRGIFQSYQSFAGYDSYAVAGELSAMADILLRWEITNRVFGAGPLLVQGLYLEAASGIGRVWGANAPKLGSCVNGTSQLVECGNGGIMMHPVNLLTETGQRSDGGLLGESSLTFKAKMALFGGYSWNSYLKFARGWQDPRMLGYRTETTTDKDGNQVTSIVKGDPIGMPFRLYIGIGTGF